MTTSGEKRPPTESTVKVDPSIEIHQTLYPYLNMKQTGLTSYMGIFYLYPFQMLSKGLFPESTPSHSNKSQPVIERPSV